MLEWKSTAILQTFCACWNNEALWAIPQVRTLGPRKLVSLDCFEKLGDVDVRHNVRPRVVCVHFATNVLVRVGLRKIVIAHCWPVYRYLAGAVEETNTLTTSIAYLCDGIKGH